MLKQLDTVALTPTAMSKKTRVSINARQIDNGYILSVSKDSPNGYEQAELAITSLPKLLKAIGTFFKENENGDDE